MINEQLKKRITEILSAPVITAEIIDELEKVILGSKTAARTTLIKAKTATATTADKRTVETLKDQVKALKDQLNTRETNSDDLLDQLYIRTVQRTHEIETKGSPVTFGTSERTYQALQINESTYYFLPGTPLIIGTEIKSDRNGLSIITGIKQVAGRIVATTFNPSSKCQSYSRTATQTGFNLKQEGTNICCKLEGDKLTTFNHCYPAGTILKLSETFYVVEGSYQDDLLVVHKLKHYQEQKQKQAVNRSVATENEFPRNYSMYHNAKM